jgi:hypothetical protein
MMPRRVGQHFELIAMIDNLSLSLLGEVLLLSPILFQTMTALVPPPPRAAGPFPIPSLLESSNPSERRGQMFRQREQSCHLFAACTSSMQECSASGIQF